MAAWQIELLLVPKRTLFEIFSAIPHDIQQADAERIAWWKNAQPPSDFQAQASSLLPRRLSWSSEVLSWGDEDGSRVNVVCEGDRVLEISLRLDVRRLQMDFLERITDFVEHCDCLLLSDDGALLEPNVFMLMSHVEKSNAFKFVEDPVGFLRQLSESRNDAI